MILKCDYEESRNRLFCCGTGEKNICDVKNLVKQAGDNFSTVGEFTGRSTLYDEYCRKNEAYFINGVKTAYDSIYSYNAVNMKEPLLLYYRRILKFFYTDINCDDFNSFIMSKPISEESVVIIASIICGSGRGNIDWLKKKNRIKELLSNFIKYLPKEYSIPEDSSEEVKNFYYRFIDALFPTALPTYISSLRDYIRKNSMLGSLEIIQIKELCSFLENLIIFDCNGMFLPENEVDSIYKNIVDYVIAHYNTPIIERLTSPSEDIKLSPINYASNLLNKTYGYVLLESFNNKGQQ